MLNYLHKDKIEAGCDEAGRGCLAGAVYAAAVILPADFKCPLLDDSKKIKEKDRYILRTIIEKEAIAWAIIIAAVLCIVFIFIGGISFILSGGQDEKIKHAVATIRYAIIGLIITILSVTMVNVVTYIFKVPFDFVSYSEIFAKVKSLSEIFQDREYGYDEYDF